MSVTEEKKVPTWDRSDWADEERAINRSTIDKVEIIRPGGKGVSIPLGDESDEEAGLLVFFPATRNYYLPDKEFAPSYVRVASHVLQLPNDKGEMVWRGINCSADHRLFLGRPRKHFVDPENCKICEHVMRREEIRGRVPSFKSLGVAKFSWAHLCWNLWDREAHLKDFLEADPENTPEEFRPPLSLLFANKTIFEKLYALHNNDKRGPLNRSRVRLFKHKKPEDPDFNVKYDARFYIDDDGKWYELSPEEEEALSWYNEGREDESGERRFYPDISMYVEPTTLEQQKEALQHVTRATLERNFDDEKGVVEEGRRAHVREPEREVPRPAAAASGRPRNRW